MFVRRILFAILLSLVFHAKTSSGQLTLAENMASVGDDPLDPGPLATDLSASIESKAITAALRKVADWQIRRIKNAPSRDWTFATLYVGLLAASETLGDASYHDTVLHVAENYDWMLGPRQMHADDQAIGQSYLKLYSENRVSERIAPLKKQFDQVMQLSDNPDKPVWWWCDALFMAPPVWAELGAITRDPKYLAYMDHEWHITSNLLWDPQERLFYRDKAYLSKREKNGRKVFWSRGNGWVMGGLVGVLEQMPQDDPRRPFYVAKLQAMASAVIPLQGKDGLWRSGLLDADDYPYPEVSGSAFFIYAITWGMQHHLLDPKQFAPVVARGWAGLVHHIYADGRLGSIQPVGEAPGAYKSGASYVFGVGAFLMAGSELNLWVQADQTKIAQ
jgi:rhamnogalacturonyl hydrolase YesR